MSYIYNGNKHRGVGIIFNTRVAGKSAKATIEMYIVARVLFLIPVLLRGELKLKFKFASGTGIIFNTRETEGYSKFANSQITRVLFLIPELPRSNVYL